LRNLFGRAREIVRQLSPDVPIFNVQTMAEQFDQSLWTRRASSWLFGSFAIIAVFLAMAGVFGIVSYSVAQRTHEIAIRIAIGAHPHQVLRHVLQRGMTLVVLGTGFGLLGALWASSLLQSHLFGIGSRDFYVFGAVVLGMISAGLIANVVPARRAASVDPMRALRSE
jgi:putative ABC transport system permease protein